MDALLAQAPVESLDDAWWTGPILASSAETAPRGHFMVEPYLYDTVTSARFDRQGARRDTTETHSVRASVFVLYGLTDDLSIGVLPSLGFNRASDSSLSSPGLGDLSFQTQYRLTEFEWGHRIPTTSILLTATLPTGRYDRLGSHPEDGLGSGAYTETASIYSQYYFGLPTGRLLRTRLDLSFSTSQHVSVRDVSVYDTPQGFHGKAAPGQSFVAYLSGEYSVTRNWVAVLEVAFQHSDSTVITDDRLRAPGHAIRPFDFNFSTGSSRSTALAPEIEYNWSGRIGLIGGVIVTVAGRNAAASLTPTLAINCNL